MKQITKNTLLKQRDKIYSTVESKSIIYWRNEYLNFVAQSEYKIEGIPVISLDSYVEKLKKSISEFSKLAKDTQEHFWTGKAAGFGKVLQIYNKSNSNQYTQKDIEKAYNLGFEHKQKANCPLILAIEKINEIETIYIDKQFNIINYE